MKIGQVPAREGWMGIPQTRVACKWSLHIPTLIELGEAIVSEWTEGQPEPNIFLLRQQGLWIMKKSLSVFFRFPEYKHRIEDQEEDSNSEQWEKIDETFCGWEKIEVARNFLRLLSLLTRFLLIIIHLLIFKIKFITIFNCIFIKIW